MTGVAGCEGGLERGKKGEGERARGCGGGYGQEGETVREVRGGGGCDEVDLCAGNVSEHVTLRSFGCASLWPPGWDKGRGTRGWMGWVGWEREANVVIAMSISELLRGGVLYLWKD